MTTVDESLAVGRQLAVVGSKMGVYSKQVVDSGQQLAVARLTVDSGRAADSWRAVDSGR